MTQSAATLVDEKLKISKLSAETKEIFSILVSYFDDVLSEKDKKIEILEGKVETLENKVKKAGRYS